LLHRHCLDGDDPIKSLDQEIADFGSAMRGPPSQPELSARWLQSQTARTG
jgi:hypothetical protein